MEEVKNGVTVIDADTLLVKDDYCTFYLHRQAPEEMTWGDAMQWAKDKGWSLPDRWQGLTIARYCDEIIKHFGEPPCWWLWTCEELSLDGAWYVDIYYGNVSDNDKCSVASVLVVSAFEKQNECVADSSKTSADEDERIRKWLIREIKATHDYDSPTSAKCVDDAIAWLERQKEQKWSPSEGEMGVLYKLCYISNQITDEDDTELTRLYQDLKREYFNGHSFENMFANEKQKEQKPIIQDVELNDAVYDYVRDHFIAGADFTPEYIKKLMENAFFAGVDYYLLKQESESCEPDTNVEKVIENVILVYEKTQGGWVGGYDVDTLIVNLRRAFNKKEQKPAEWSEEEKKKHCVEILDGQGEPIVCVTPQIPPSRSLWKPSKRQMEVFKQSIEWNDDIADEFDKTLQSLYNNIKDYFGL